jgi:hypothetical protein
MLRSIPMDVAFANAPEPEATEAEIAALCEARAKGSAGAALIPHEEVMRRAREHFGVEGLGSRVNGHRAS